MRILLSLLETASQSCMGWFTMTLKICHHFSFFGNPLSYYLFIFTANPPDQKYQNNSYADPPLQSGVLFASPALQILGRKGGISSLSRACLKHIFVWMEQSSDNTIRNITPPWSRKKGISPPGLVRLSPPPPAGFSEALVSHTTCKSSAHIPIYRVLYTSFMFFKGQRGKCASF